MLTVEDEFHHSKTRMWLCATFHNVEEEYLHERFQSERITTLLQTIPGGTYETVLEGKHPAFKLQNKLLYLNHRKIGGPSFLRLIEALINVPHRTLPRSNILLGLLYACRHAFTFAKFLWRPLTNNTTRGLLYHGTKNYHIESSDFNRRLHSFWIVLQDVAAVLQKTTLWVGFSVVFEEVRVVNSVGIVILQFDRQMTLRDFIDEFEARRTTAIATNALSALGKYTIRFTAQDGVTIRKRLDAVVTSLGLEDTSALSVSIKAAGPVYEGAYISMYTQLRPNREVDILAAVSTHVHGWETVGFSASKSVAATEETIEEREEERETNN